MRDKRQAAMKGEESLFSLNRRAFLKTLGGGIIVFLSAGILPAQERASGPVSPQLPDDYNAFLHIGEDGRVACFTGKIEMGQGIITSLAQMLADELDVPTDRVDMVMGDTDQCPFDMGTFGSRSTRFFGPPLRQAAAEARGVLLSLASAQLKAPVDRLEVSDGVVFDKENRQSRVSYGRLTRGRYIEKHLSQKPSVKGVAALKVMGKPLTRTDAARKVAGTAQYAGDIRLPGMLYARILRPPSHGSRLKRIDTSAVRADEGILVVREGDLVAVLHPMPEVAEEALSRIVAEFDTPDSSLDNATIFDHLLRRAPADGEVVSEGGSIEEGERTAVRLFEETYYDHYMAHATVETHAATAKIEAGQVTVWPSTQRPFATKEDVAKALGVPLKRVRVIVPFVGGGFGGKSNTQQSIEAARLAKLTGRPVQVMWTRKEEFFYDTFRPAAIVKIRSGLSGDKKIASWQYDVFYAGPRGAEQIYGVPHHREVSHVHYTGADGAHPFATGPWRAPGNSTNTFARESHVNIMAAAAGVDPVSFRLRNLTDARMANVLKTAAARFGWKEIAGPTGRGVGVACAKDADTYVATAVEIHVGEDGRIRVERMVHAQDMGFAINPEGARLQMEGALTMGMGYALTEEIIFKGGRILTNNFDTYDIPRFSWLPGITTILVENRETPPGGGGEPAITCVGAAIANALFDATGARVYEMPITAARVREAVAALQKRKEK